MIVIVFDSKPPVAKSPTGVARAYSAAGVTRLSVLAAVANVPAKVKVLAVAENVTEVMVTAAPVDTRTKDHAAGSSMPVSQLSPIEMLLPTILALTTIDDVEAEIFSNLTG